MRFCSLSTFTALALLTLVSNVQGYVPFLQQTAVSSRSSSLAPCFAETTTKSTSSSDSFIQRSFFTSSECDDVNTPPSLSILLRSLDQLPSGSDIRGRFVDHSRVGSIANVAHAIGAHNSGGIAPLTPIAAHCFGHAFARMLQERNTREQDKQQLLTVAVGNDPRPHGSRLCDAFARGVQSVEGVQVHYTGLATTPSMFEFCRARKCDGAVMVTASHLPVDRNGLKFVTREGGFRKSDVKQLVEYAKEHAQYWHDQGILPPTSGKDAVFCSEWVSSNRIVWMLRGGNVHAHNHASFSMKGGSHASLCIDTQECNSQGGWYR